MGVAEVIEGVAATNRWWGALWPIDESRAIAEYHKALAEGFSDGEAVWLAVDRLTSHGPVHIGEMCWEDLRGS